MARSHAAITALRRTATTLHEKLRCTTEGSGAGGALAGCSSPAQWPAGGASQHERLFSLQRTAGWEVGGGDNRGA